MTSRLLLRTLLCAVLALAASSAVALGQNDPADCLLRPGAEDDAPPFFPERLAKHARHAGCCDVGGCLTTCRPRWTASAEFITLERVGSVPYTLVETVPATVKFHDLSKTPGNEMLNANDFRHGFFGGPRIGLIHHGDNDGDLEVSYFQIDGWDSYRSVGPTPDDWLIMRAQVGFLQTQDNKADQMMAWNYVSRLYNAEVNMRRNPWRRVTVLAGFRWVNVSEDLQGRLPPERTVPFWESQTKNNLYGLQIGAEGNLFERGRFAVDGMLKTGIFDNHVEEATTVSIDRILFGESATTDHLAFLGEIGVRCKYQVTSRLSLKVGYEAIWLQGVALAPGQIPKTHCHSGVLPQTTYVEALGVNCSSGVFFHGATAGLEYSF